ncbi:MAG TPA: NAD(P)-binding domain-containing protein, partial [Pyrinomonadaceae bacterium]
MPAKKRKEKPAVSIIGTGRLGTALALALSGSGYPLRSLVARQIKSARKAAALLHGKVDAYAANKIGLLPQADLFLISTPDDQIATVAAQLATLGFDRKPVVLHTSGALSSEVLSP